MANSINMREVALDILLMVERKEELSHVALFQALTKYQYIEKKERSFLTRLVEGTLEYGLTLDYIINAFSTRPVNKCKPLIRCLLRMSVYQMIYMDHVPASAACNEAVKLAKKRGFQKLSGFINGVLRSVERSLLDLPTPKREENELEYLSITYSMPSWIVEKWIEWYGIEVAEQMLSAGFQEQKTRIRMNQSKCKKEELVESLKEQGVMVEDGQYLKEAMVISDYDYILALTAFQKGWFSIQDESSAMVAYVAGIEKGMQIYDVCAAPGGKTMHAADILDGTGMVYSFDISEYKTDRIRENVTTCGFTNVLVKEQDATVLNPQFIEKADVVFLDAPCSGMGIMGHKNDMKYRLNKEQLSELMKLQSNMFSVVSQYVKPGGVLIYSTCTVNPKENLENVKEFIKDGLFSLEEMKEKELVSVNPDTAKQGYLQLLQGVHGKDGFFIAKLRRK